MEQWQIRLLDERNELHKRIIALTDFLSNIMAGHRLPSKDHIRLLKDQKKAMWSYHAILSERIKLFSNIT